MLNSVKISCYIIVLCFMLSVIFLILHIISVNNNVDNSYFGEVALYILIVAFIVVIFKISQKRDIRESTYSKVKILPI